VSLTLSKCDCKILSEVNFHATFDSSTSSLPVGNLRIYEESTMRIYLSGALTGVPNIEELKRFYEAIAELCTSMGHEIYVPHLHSDPDKHADISARLVYVMDQNQVLESELVLAYVGRPSLGVGQEIEIAKGGGIEVFLLFEKDTRVSRMTRGSPNAVAEVVFSDFDDALVKLREALTHYAGIV
jgi:2'-deoxynucleoside 5'-phosphate N-hydrolase